MIDFFKNMDPQIFNYVVLPFLIFISRVFDVSLGTLRIIFVSKGMKILAPIIGFFEVLIWLVVIGQIMNNISHPINYVAYALGFAAGNYIGIFLENKLAVGILLVRIITRKKAKELIMHLRSQGYIVTNVPAIANESKVEIIFLPILRKDLKAIIKSVKSYNPNASFTIEDVRALSDADIPYIKGSKLGKYKYKRLFRYKRKAK